MIDDAGCFDYFSYIESDEWRERARSIRERDGYRCQICGADDTPLEVHHLTYDNLGQELDEDLITVCHSCHEKITRSWHSIRDGVKARNAYLYGLARNYECAHDLASRLNTLMPYDISFGGKYVLSSHKDIKDACKEAGVECRNLLAIQHIFNGIHVLDVVTQINNGVSRRMLADAGYPMSLVRDIAKRQEKNRHLVDEISDELICYIHEGRGKWIVAASEDGLDTGFDVRFMPYKRYRNAWWER